MVPPARVQQLQAAWNSCTLAERRHGHSLRLHRATVQMLMAHSYNLRDVLPEQLPALATAATEILHTRFPWTIGMFDAAVTISNGAGTVSLVPLTPKASALVELGSNDSWEWLRENRALQATLHTRTKK